MTAAQTKARARFKSAVEEAGKLRAKNPRLSQAEAVKQAWAILYGKERAKKKIGAKPKRATKTAKTIVTRHKDTKSHNVNIRVVSGVKKMGALPIGFTGMFLGWRFKVLNQYTLDGGVTAQIVETAPPGDIVAELNGRPGDAERAIADVMSILKKLEGDEAYGPELKRETNKIFEQLNKAGKGRVATVVKQFFTELNKEVKAYNGGDKKTTTKKPAVIKYTPAVKKLALIDEIKNLLTANKKRLKYGYKTVPGRPKIKASDIVGAIMNDAAAGVKKYAAHLAAIRHDRDVTKKRTTATATERKLKASHLADLRKAETLTKKKLDQLKKQIS